MGNKDDTTIDEKGGINSDGHTNASTFNNGRHPESLHSTPCMTLS